MHTCIPSHRLKRSWHSCPWRVNVGNKNTPNMHYPRRWNVTTSMVRLKNGHVRKNLTQNGEPQRYSWGTQKKKRECNLRRRDYLFEHDFCIWCCLDLDLFCQCCFIVLSIVILHVWAKQRSLQRAVSISFVRYIYICFFGFQKTLFYCCAAAVM